VNATAAPRKHTRTFGKHAWLSVLGGLVMALAMAGMAEAYWTAGGTGSGSGPVGTLTAPTSLSGIAGAGTVALSWSPAGLPLGVSDTVYYYVTRDGVSPASTCPTQAAPTSVLTCTDSGVPVGTHSYTVTAVWQSWTATRASLPVAVASGALNHFVLAAATTRTAGQADNLTITAKDSAGNTVTSYIGSHNLTFAGASTIGTYIPTVTNLSGSAINFGTATPITFAAGVSTVGGVMTLYKVETANITVAEGGSYTSSPLAVTVSAAAINKLSLAAATTTPTAGQTDNLTITALDLYGNTATSYTGSHDLTFSGASPIGSNSPTVTNLSGSATIFGTATAISFTSGVATVSGTNNGVMTLYKVETANITVSDGSGHSNGAGLSVTISASTASKLAFTQSPSGTTVAGVAFVPQPQVTVQDQFGNTVTGDTSNVTISVTSGTPTSGGPGSVTGCTQIESSGVITFSGCKITTVGTGYRLHATDGILTAADSTAFNITPGAEAGIVLSYVSPPGVACVGPIDDISCSGAGGQSGYDLAANLTLVDGFGNVVKNETGSPIGIVLSTSGHGNVNPPGGTLWIPNGSSSGSFTLTLGNGNSKIVTMTATVNGALLTITLNT
jgi:hypothetical protein